MITVVLLPGMNGTGHLLHRFMAALPAALNPVAITYPVDQPLGYTELEALVVRSLPAEGPYLLLGESFSGPLALRIAARGDARLAAVILVGSFARNPLPGMRRWLGWLVGPWCFWFAPPAWIVRRFLAGSDASDELVAEFQAALKTVAAGVMSRRAKEVLDVDVWAILPRIRVPVLMLAGDHDRLVAKDTNGDFLALGDRFEVISIDSPHLILQREPAAAAAAINAFLERRLPRAR